MVFRKYSLFIFYLICAGQIALAQTGIIQTYAGTGTGSFSGDGGAATNATIFQPFGLAVDSSGNLYIADVQNARVRKVDASTLKIATVAGGGLGGDGGLATGARRSGPCGVKGDSSANLYLSHSCLWGSPGSGAGSGSG